MTSLAEERAKPVPRSRLLWLALALSVTLNIFFIGGLIWSQMAVERQPTFAERIVEAGAALNLSPEQRQAFQKFADTVQIQTKQMRERNQPLFRRIWEELAKTQPDTALIGQLVDEASDTRHAYQKDVTTAMAGFLMTLSPDQRAEFIESAKHHQSPRLLHLVKP